VPASLLAIIAASGWLSGSSCASASASGGAPADRRRLAETVHAADDDLTMALARVQERWGSDPAQWLTFGMTLAMSQRILAEAGRPIH
jgi:hypothetical protein